ncbi:hypothetical protein V5P93_003152 [Actinokineospora auranticolor]|uniref:Secreted protein n=1 Tax=Actinokineospora auranticolor TaxID=155976 RepID=A0A2S6H1J7_9PSEU|nr:hypothetical protein [Actinokineospora auranticolor]PPK71287.1 hypothetical protein CLV40_101476 [Actinokineospora auranticolor]
MTPSRRPWRRLFTVGVFALAALFTPTTAGAESPATPRTIVEPHCGGEWVDYNGAENRRMKSQPGSWRLHSYYGVQMKDVLGNWGSSVSATHEATFEVACP